MTTPTTCTEQVYCKYIIALHWLAFCFVLVFQGCTVLHEINSYCNIPTKLYHYNFNNFDGWQPKRCRSTSPCLSVNCVHVTYRKADARVLNCDGDKYEFILEQGPCFHRFLACAFPFLRSWTSRFDRSISKCYPKNNAAPWVEKSSTSRAFRAHVTRFFWSLENTLHECFITEWWRSSLNGNTTAHCSAVKNANVLVWI